MTVFGIFELNLKFLHEVGLNIKMPVENVVQIDKKKHENAKKQGGGVESTPPSSTSLKYLRNERIDQRFHLLISKFATFWSWSPSQSLHKKQLLRLNKTGKNPCFFKWLFIFNPNRHGGGGNPPPSSFYELYEKIYEIEICKSLTFKEI